MELPKKILFFFIGLLIFGTIIIFAIKIWNNNHLAFKSSLDELKSLPYLTWTDEKVNESLLGVIFYDTNNSFDGYNLYLDLVDRAYLMDMSGKIVHTWHFPIKCQWEYAEILENGEIVAVCVDKEVAKIDWHSNVIWERKMSAHHDIKLLSDGTYLVPNRHPRKYNSYDVLFDSITHLSVSGEILDEWSTFENLNKIKQYHPPSALDIKDKSLLDELLSPYYKNTYDYYHLNSIQILPDTPLGKKDKRFQKGNWLISLRNTDLIIILEKDTKEIVWYWGPSILDRHHTPTMLENGDILIFDNGYHRNFSRVIQLNPVNYTIVWEYKTNPPEKFYSKIAGSAQSLPNGNILITESEKGHVFEITKNGKIVWDFYNSEIEGGHPKRIYRMMRLDSNLLKNIESYNEST